MKRAATILLRLSASAVLAMGLRPPGAAAADEAPFDQAALRTQAGRVELDLRRNETQQQRLDSEVREMLDRIERLRLQQQRLAAEQARLQAELAQLQKRLK